jgi:hypothetical protein
MSNVANFPLTGPDLVDVDGLDPLAGETTSEAQNLSQDCYHWLEALPGSNPDDVTRGVGVDQYLSGTDEQLRDLPGAIEADFIKDFRIQACAADVTQDQDGGWVINVQIEAIIGVFSLSFGYSQAGGLVILQGP